MANWNQVKLWARSIIIALLMIAVVIFIVVFIGGLIISLSGWEW